MSNHPALEARCAYALFKVLGEVAAPSLARAKALALECGYAASPEREVSPFFSSEPVLLTEYMRGWAQREEELRPRSEEDLQAHLDRLAAEASRGSGLFYELYAQNFTDAVDDWLEGLPEADRLLAKPLLAATDYIENATGYWEYDAEEGDINFVQTSR